MFESDLAIKSLPGHSRSKAEIRGTRRAYGSQKEPQVTDHFMVNMGPFCRGCFILWVCNHPETPKVYVVSLGHLHGRL